ncbi:ABC transporter ATP-binding protein [Mesorhizobium sp. 2RAF21]|uniref:ABC transporter ATP-binding protein n=1 Tax=Mesorhizobium sp. 2RAF21 TaxID=3232995 RepID=UPI003F96BCBC
MLEVRGLDVNYGGTQVLWDLSLTVGNGEIVSVMGPNGSGKSTVLKAIIGLVKQSSGTITLAGRDVSRSSTSDRVGLGLSLVLERRRLFTMMTVHENLLMGAYHPNARKQISASLAWVESLFPILRERRHQRAGLMSGGEQQMVAIARGLMSRPKIIMLDEPFLGLTPKMVEQTVEIMRTINRAGVAVLFNEQNVETSFGFSDRGYVLESGRMVIEGSGLSMLDHPEIRRVYLGLDEVRP